MRKLLDVIFVVAMVAAAMMLGVSLHRGVAARQEFRAEFNASLPWGTMSVAQKNDLQQAVGTKMLTLWRDRVAYSDTHLCDNEQCIQDHMVHLVATERELGRATSLAINFGFDTWPICHDGSYPTSAGCPDGSR